MLLQELAIDRYTFPNSSPRYGNENLSYLARDFSYTSTDVSTEDELDESEDGSTSIGISHFTIAHCNGKPAEHQVRGTCPGTAWRSAGAVADVSRWDILERLAPPTPT